MKQRSANLFRGGLLAALIVSFLAIAQPAQSTPQPTETSCILASGIVKDAAGNTVTDGEVYAFAQPSQQVFAELPTGSEVEFPLIATGTTSASGFFILYVAEEEIEALLAGNPSFNFTLYASNGEAYGISDRAQSSCQPIWPSGPSAEPGEPLALEHQVTDASTPPSGMIESADDAPPFHLCTTEHIGDYRVDVGRAYNQSTTGAIVQFELKRGASTSVSKASRIGVPNVGEWELSSERTMTRTSELPLPPLTGDLGSGEFETTMEFQRLDCWILTAYGPLGERTLVEPYDFAGGSYIEPTSGPMPDFSNDEENCKEYEGGGYTKANTRAETLTDGVKLGNEYGGISLSTRTGYTTTASIKVTSPQNDDGTFVPVRVCGLHDDPEGNHPGPGLIIVRDIVEPPDDDNMGPCAPPCEPPVEGTVYSGLKFETQGNCLSKAKEGYENNTWEYAVCTHPDQTAGYSELWVRYPASK